MKVPELRRYACWALSKKFDHNHQLLGRYCWGTSARLLTGVPIPMFETRKQAREAQLTCCHKKTRVERVYVTIERQVQNDS